jgi:hypothetical protein
LVQCIFLGYNLNNKGYLCLDYLTRQVYVTPHVVFYETQFPFNKNLYLPQTDDASSASFPPVILSSSSCLPYCPIDKHTSMSTDVIPTKAYSLSLSESATSPISHSSPKSIHNDQTPESNPVPRMTTRLMRGITKKKVILDLIVVKISEPYTLNQALKDPHWTNAMDQDIAALHRNHTWDLVAKPSDVNIIGCK